MKGISGAIAVALGTAALIGTSSAVQAQTASPAPAAPPAQAAQPAQTAQPEPAAQPAPASQPAPAAQSTAPKLTFQGDVALLTVAIRPDQTAAFEAVMKRVSEALKASSDPLRQKQAAGWKVMKLPRPLADGNIAYIHVINPVVADADYSVMQILADAFPDEKVALYEQYRAAFAANLSLATGHVALDLSPNAPAAANATR